MLTAFSFSEGSHRIADPEETLRRIRPHLPAMGITRSLDITGLDTLGIPTFCATRPRGLLLQTSAGKGRTRASAQVSALMESIELFHAENPPPLARASMRELQTEGWTVVEPARLDGFLGTYFTPDFRIHWVEAESLPGRKKVQIPAGTVYFTLPALHGTHTNGLASGNNLDEATLHALYELIERDAVSRLRENGRIEVRKHCRIIDLTTITDPGLRRMISQIEEAETKVVLISVPSCVPVHTFWAVLLNRQSFQPASTMNMGYGTHASIEVAASRALTEAAQTRGSAIHGSREDVHWKPVRTHGDITGSAPYRYFDGLPQDASWIGIAETHPPVPGTAIEDVLAWLIDALLEAGHTEIYRHDLTRPEFGIPVVKMLVPTLQFNWRSL